MSDGQTAEKRLCSFCGQRSVSSDTGDCDFCEAQKVHIEIHGRLKDATARLSTDYAALRAEVERQAAALKELTARLQDAQMLIKTLVTENSSPAGIEGDTLRWADRWLDYVPYEYRPKAAMTDARAIIEWLLSAANFMEPIGQDATAAMSGVIYQCRRCYAKGQDWRIKHEEYCQIGQANAWLERNKE